MNVPRYKTSTPLHEPVFVDRGTETYVQGKFSKTIARIPFPDA